MDLNTFSKILGVGASPNGPGDETLNLTNIMHVKVTRVVDENLSVVLPNLLESELHTANVVLMLDNQTKLKAHKCFLSASPVLKEVLMSLEARLDKLPHISMPDYSRDCVVSFLHFLYKGFVVLENTNIQQEFLRLCRTLKVNPPVVRDGDSQKPSSSDTIQDENIGQNSAFSDLSDDDVEIEDASDNNNDNASSDALAAVAPPLHEECTQSSVEVEKDTNSNVLIREPQNEGKNKIGTIDEDKSLTLPNVNNSDKIDDISHSSASVSDIPKAVTDDDLISDQQSSSIIERKNSEAIPSSVPDSEVASTCDNPEPINSSDYESLPLIDAPTEDDYDDETTEHISDFLNLLNTKSLNEKKAQEENLEEPQEEPEPFDTFKMPESFDIPQDYIKEIVPYNSTTPSTVSFQVSDDESDNKFAEIVKPIDGIPDAVNDDVKLEPKALEATSEKQDKKIVRNLNFDDDIFKEEFIDNTPVQDEIEQITYKKDESSRRYRDSTKPKQKKAYNPKKDRKKVIASLFSDSDVDLPSTSSKKLSFKDNNDNRALTPSSEESRTPTPTTSLRNELEEKKERMKKKLKRAGGDDVEDPRLIEYRKKKKQMKESTPRKSHTSGSTPSKVHVCNSSCMCVKNIRHEEDNKWLVDDTYESSDDRVGKSSETDETSDSNAKTEKKSSQKKKLIHKKRIIPAEDSSDEDTDLDEDPEDRRKRLDDRKKRKGGDVLAWMSRKASVSVSVQTKPKGVILDMALYKMQLLAADGTDESEHEAEPSKKQTDTESDDEIPRGKRISPVKMPGSEDDLRKHKKKLKKHKKKRKRVRHSPDPTFPVEEVVWTPAMYKKWDETRQKKGGGYDSDSDAPRPKHKKLHRSLSSEPKPSIESFKHHNKSSQQPKIQRSMSSLESLGIAHNYGPSSLTKPATSLPKIPKLKKPDQGKL